MEFKQLGAVLKRCRELKGMTVKELAVLAGVHRNTLSAYEGGRMPNDKAFVHLCLLLGMSVGEVFAAACLAKLDSDLRPLEDRKRAEMGLPARNREKTTVERHEELLERYSIVLKDMERFKLEQLGPHLQEETLIRLTPASLRGLDPGESKPRQRRKKPRRKGDAS